MVVRTRRQFCEQVGRGMLVASVGATMVADLGLAPAQADTQRETPSFGAREALVGLMQDTPLERFLPKMIEQIRQGTSLRELVAAAALANTRKFGGEDYIGFHTLMALAPAWQMSGEMPSSSAALPVLKVLYRNASRIQDTGGRASEVLHPIKPSQLSGKAAEDALRAAVRGRRVDEAEAAFAALAQGSPLETFNHLLTIVEDNTDVHRVVLPYRAWVLLDLVGAEQAHTMLRQSLRYCVDNEKHNDGRVRRALAKVLDQYKLVGRPLGNRQVDDAWIDRMSGTLLQASDEQGANAVGAALHEGIAAASIAEAITLAANQILLRDPGRRPQQACDLKPAGSVHGDSMGVHASDAVNAWINMSQVANDKHQAAALILAGYEVARDSKRDPNLPKATPRPLPEDLAHVRATDPQALLKDLDAAIRANAQGVASAIVHQYGASGHAPRPVFDLLLKYATSEDGALHAEKYYQTVSQEFARSRPAFRWRQLVGLARVTASEYGRRAAGYDDACRLLGV